MLYETQKMRSVVEGKKRLALNWLLWLQDRLIFPVKSHTRSDMSLSRLDNLDSLNGTLNTLALVLRASTQNVLSTTD